MNLLWTQYVTLFAEILARALIHFVWQGAVLTLLPLVAVKILDVRTARFRYLLSVGTLLMMGMAPFLTALQYHNEILFPRHSATDLSVQSKEVSEAHSSAMLDEQTASVATNDANQGLCTKKGSDPLRASEFKGVTTPSKGSDPFFVQSPNQDSLWASTARWNGNIEFYVLVLWLAGVFILSIRLMVGYGVTLWIRKNVVPLSEEFEQRVHLLGKKLGLNARQRVFTCVRVGQAVAVGFIRPIVLIPVAWLTQLTPQMLEAVIAHELAHIRRFDLWVNLVQRVIETLLFYHPAVWWLSSRIRLEREMCCDEIAASCFDRAIYARSLESVARIAHGNLLMAASINGGKRMNLLNRVRYLLGAAPADATVNWWAVGFVVLILPIAALVALSLTAGTTPKIAKAGEGTKAVKSDFQSESPSEFEGKNAGDRKEAARIALRWCPAGTFTMGSPGATNDESPVEVTLTKGFWLGETEVTQGQWKKLMGTTQWRGQSFWNGQPVAKEGSDYAASYISHDDAVAFCKKLTTQERSAGRLPEGWKYTLPTEAQWEYACRAGTTTMYSFGDNESGLNEFGWFVTNATDIKETYAHQVGLKKANAWGLKDMHGNVWEWCSDWSSEKLSGGRDPQGSSSGTNRVARGGCWGDCAVYCRSAFRFRDSPVVRYNNRGFRLAAVPTNE